MCKVVNEVYSSFNRGQHCTLVLFIDLDPSKPFIAMFEFYALLTGTYFLKVSIPILVQI